MALSRRLLRLTFSHLARCAAAIFFLPAAEIVRFGLFACPFAFVHCFFCTMLIRLRAEADNVGCPFALELPKAARRRSAAQTATGPAESEGQ